MGNRRRGKNGCYLPKSAPDSEVMAVDPESRPERRSTPAGRKAVEAAAPPPPPARVKVAWTAAREETFFRELSEVCNVIAAARAAGLPDSKPAYNRKACDPRFRAAWNDAVAEGYARLELEMLERARFGENRRLDQGVSGEKQRAIPTALALSLLRMHHGRAKAVAAAAASTAAQPRPMRGQRVRDEMEARFREISFRLTGQG
jgi:hypothetical protein